MGSPSIVAQGAYVSGFEQNTFGKNSPSDGNITIQTTVKRTGSYACKVDGQSGTKSSLIMTTDDTVASAAGFFREYIQIVALPTSARTIWCQSTVVSNGAWGLRLQPDGHLTLYNGTTDFATSSIQLLPTTGDDWYRIEVGLNATDEKMSVRVNGRTEIDWTGDGGAGTVPTISQATIGVIDTVAAALVYYIDDVAFDLNDWCGPGRVKLLQVTGVGGVTAAGFSAAGSSPAATKWQSLNELGTDDGVTIVTTGTTTNIRETYTLADLPADCVEVRRIMLRMRVKRNGASNGTISFATRAYGRNTNFVLTTTTATYTWLESTMVNASAKPLGNLTWNNDRINNLEIGFLTSSVNTSEVSTLAAEVDYDDTPGAGRILDRLYATGYESGEVGEHDAVTGTAAVATNQARTGTYSLRINPVGSTASHVRHDITRTPAVQEAYASLYIWVTAYPTGASFARIVSFNAGVSHGVAVQMDSAGKINFSDRNGTIGTLSASGIPTGQWVRIDFHARSSTTNAASDGVAEVLVNGVSYCSSSAINTTNTTFTNIALGATAAPGAGGVDYNFDDFVADASDWIAPNDDIRVRDYVPTANGALTGTGFTVVGPASQWDALDETPVDDDTSYVLTGTTNPSIGSFVTQNIHDEAAQVRSVTIIAKVKRDGASNGSFIPMAITGGHSGSGATLSAGAAYGWQRAQLMQTDHDGAWTAGLFNDTELAIQNGSATNKTRITSLRATVEYVKAGAAGPGGAIASQLFTVG